MNKDLITESVLNSFCKHLIKSEKSNATIDKYLRDVRAFGVYAGRRPLSKELIIAYKYHLRDSHYAASSINSMLASVNCFLDYAGFPQYRVKGIRTQRRAYCSYSQELTKAEYVRLLTAASHDRQLRLVMETICSTGIRVSELQYFTVQGVSSGEITVNCKNKIRTILVPGKLRKILLRYAREQEIISGPIFITRCGNPLDRSNIWSKMKKLCSIASVDPGKVFPHNLRKLFARTFYSLEKDIAKLADILGHSNINTTRIYIITTVTEHRKKIERLGLVI